MKNELRFEQLHRILGNPPDSRLGRSALRLYESTLERPLVWLKNRHVFVTTEEKTVRGVANVEIRPSRYAYLIGIAVAPAHRDRGIGTFMMENLLQYVESQNCTHIHVIPKDGVEDFYARLGFVRRSDRSSYWIRYF